MPSGGSAFHNEDFDKELIGDDISVANSYADQMGYVDQLNDRERNMLKTR